jgi:hypothetical protein
MTTKTHRADILQGYIDSGLDPAAAIAKLKEDHPEYSPSHRNKQGEPQTFEAVVSDFIRNQGFKPDHAIRAASTREPRMQKEYYDRLRVGAALDLDRILEGYPV